MIRLARKIRETVVEEGSLAIFWISQAGFVYKTPSGQVIYVDPYLTDYAHRLFPNEGYGFKRIVGTPIEAEEVEADFVVSTHAHADHLDADAIAILSKNPRAHFLGAPDCRAEYEKLSLLPEQG